MKTSKYYITIQKFLFHTFKKLNFTWIADTEIVTISKVLRKQPFNEEAFERFKSIIHSKSPHEIVFERDFSYTLYNMDHTFQQAEICLILEKYVYCYRILTVAPLTKYLHLNFTFLKSENSDNYKIKINYILAVPKKLTNITKLKSLLHSTSDLIPSLMSETTIQNVPKFPKTINLHTFLRIIKNKKFYRTLHFFNLLKYPSSDKKEANAIESICNYNSLLATVCNKPQISSKNQIFGPFGSIEFTPYNIFPITYTETFKCCPHTHKYNIFKILTTNLIRIFNISTTLEYFYFLFFNYCIINNIYIKNNKLYKIEQKHEITKNVIQTFKAYVSKREHFILKTLIINPLPITSKKLGNVSWFFKNLKKIATEMSILCPTHISIDDIFSKYVIVENKKNTEKVLNYLINRGLPTKKDIFAEKEYYSNGTVYFNWTTCMVLHTLKKHRCEEPEFEYFKEFAWMEIGDLEDLLIWTNIYLTGCQNSSSSIYGGIMFRKPDLNFVTKGSTSKL